MGRGTLSCRGQMEKYSTAPVPPRAMTHEQAPAWRDPGGRRRDGPGAFPSEQHLPPPSTAVHGGLRAGQASCCEAGGAGARGNACKGRRAGQSEVGWTTCAPGARRTLSMLLLLVFGGKGIYNKWC